MKFPNDPLQEWMRNNDRTPVPITPDANTPDSARRTLAYTGGYPLLYFSTYADLCRFFVDVLKWENRPDELLPELKHEKEFVLHANAKGILIAPGVAAYFRDPRNPMYDPLRATHEGSLIFRKPGFCPPDLIRYAVQHDLLPVFK